MIEYKVIEKKHSDLKELLNDLGKDSWELCGVYEHDFIFKRRFAHSYDSGRDYSWSEPPYKVTCNASSDNDSD